jgi:pilus assembly protein Flp/PilA
VKLAGDSAAVDYAVKLALIIVLCISATPTLGTNASRPFASVDSAAKPAAAGS